MLTASNPVPLEGESLCLKLVPDTAEGKVTYHNQLMQACGLSLRELAAAMEAAEVLQLQVRYPQHLHSSFLLFSGMLFFSRMRVKVPPSVELYLYPGFSRMIFNALKQRIYNSGRSWCETYLKHALGICFLASTIEINGPIDNLQYKK